MEARTHSTLLRWLLLCALAIGVIGMHHMATTSADPVPGIASHSVTSHMDHDGPESGSDPRQPVHDLAHWCMAVLFTFAGTALILVGLFVAYAMAVRVVPAACRRLARSHGPPGGRLLLTSVCVLRI
ncbi:hypothetical protein [Actinokineospora sp. HUAS TT18]|uniref:hypothetical protein n=1 Tax=Actinokineospora sp. HUAS TT18 TaxID=3447451 RepID=UPI003F528981